MQPMKLIWIVLLGFGLLASACRREAPQNASPSTNAGQSPELKTFLVNGTLQKLDVVERTATIQHEEIPGYMAAMTMPFTVKNTNELAGLQPGDQVVFRLNVRENDSWIDKLKKAPAPVPAEPPTRE